MKNKTVNGNVIFIENISNVLTIWSKLKKNFFGTMGLLYITINGIKWSLS